MATSANDVTGPVLSSLGEISGFLLSYASLLATNLFAAALVLTRKIGLKATGQKLAHLDHELHGQATSHHDGEDAEE